MNRRLRPLAALGTVVVAAALALGPSVGASAATPTGWVRVAHLSPNTKAVDVTLSSLSGGTLLYKLSDVAYGDVSKYMKLAAGTYAIAMVPANDPTTSTPIVNASVTVSAGRAETVAAIGLNKDLKTKVIGDNLDQTAGDQARVRIVQASTTHDSVDVKAGSTNLANDAVFGSVSTYHDVTAGDTTFNLTAAKSTAAASVDLAPGSVHTVFVIDNAKGGLSIASALDSSAATVAPVGSIDTGAGGLARADGADAGVVAASLAGGTAVLAVALFAIVLRRQRRVVASTHH